MATGCSPVSPPDSSHDRWEKQQRDDADDDGSDRDVDRVDGGKKRFVRLLR
jgi:hypothetical protein